ncbi:hypothetical protein Mycsm_03724 [Mycobacterium sp. JS623]|nr:hypothetical protein [Mycobacterium sp. JS623]AGB24000.1 hypothetical protein Mycsm_03724 [Mycobacterium sp. JS623]
MEATVFTEPERAALEPAEQGTASPTVAASPMKRGPATISQGSSDSDAH